MPRKVETHLLGLIYRICNDPRASFELPKGILGSVSESNPDRAPPHLVNVNPPPLRHHRAKLRRRPSHGPSQAISLAQQRPSLRRMTTTGANSDQRRRSEFHPDPVIPSPRPISRKRPLCATTLAGRLRCLAKKTAASWRALRDLTLCGHQGASGRSKAAKRTVRFRARRSCT